MRGVLKFQTVKSDEEMPALEGPVQVFRSYSDGGLKVIQLVDAQKRQLVIRSDSPYTNLQLTRPADPEMVERYVVVVTVPDAEPYRLGPFKTYEEAEKYTDGNQHAKVEKVEVPE